MLPQTGPQRDLPRIHLGFTLICLPAWHRWHYLRPLDRLAVVRREAYLPKQRRLGIVLLLLAKSWAGMGKPLSLVLKLVLSNYPVAMQLMHGCIQCRRESRGDGTCWPAAALPLPATACSLANAPAIQQPHSGRQRMCRQASLRPMFK